MTSSTPPISSHDSDVPTFGCIVYVSKVDSGVQARMGNLDDLVCVGASERDALGKMVAEIKSRIRTQLETDEELQWLDPPLKIQPDEQKRFIPVHL